MNHHSTPTAHPTDPGQASWLTAYYWTRGAFSLAWVLAAVNVSARSSSLAALLLVCYPAWDGLANLVDGAHNGGLGRNRTQALNAAISLLVAVAIAVALPDRHQVLGIFGLWAVLAGLLQLATGLRRWSTQGAQWAMILSGAQSALAGAVFLFQAQTPALPSLAPVIGYAGFGAFYFLLSAVARTLRRGT